MSNNYTTAPQSSVNGIAAKIVLQNSDGSPVGPSTPLSVSSSPAEMTGESQPKQSVEDASTAISTGATEGRAIDICRVTDSSDTLWISRGTTAAVEKGYPLLARGTVYTCDELTMDDFYGISDGGTIEVTITPRTVAP